MEIEIINNLEFVISFIDFFNETIDKFLEKYEDIKEVVETYRTLMIIPIIVVLFIFILILFGIPILGILLITIKLIFLGIWIFIKKKIKSAIKKKLDKIKKKNEQKQRGKLFKKQQQQRIFHDIKKSVGMQKDINKMNEYEKTKHNEMLRNTNSNLKNMWDDSVKYSKRGRIIE